MARCRAAERGVGAAGAPQLALLPPTSGSCSDEDLVKSARLRLLGRLGGGGMRNAGSLALPLALLLWLPPPLLLWF